ncbi:ERCC4 domain-containing protein [Nemania sp. FL0916]|nr:ERCC4 domain-containing protein [Nemania sp. FL0916]
MPTEVISLLSSSPARPTTSESAKGLHSRVPLTALDCNLAATTTHGSSFQALSNPAAGTKRALNHQTCHNDHDFLFLSDDFDTTGDLDGSVYKKPRTSTGLLRHGGGDKGTVSPAHEPVKIVSSRHEPSQTLETKRYRNLVEDIEFSSSPAALARLEANKRVPNILSDPFASPQNEAILMSRSQNPAFESLFCSSPEHSDMEDRQESRNQPTNFTNSPSIRADHQPTKTVFVDLLSDPIDSPPPADPPPKLSNALAKTIWDPISSSVPQSYDIQDLLSSPPAVTETRSHLHTKARARADCSDSDELPDLDNVDFSKIRAAKHSQGSFSSRPTARAPKRSVNKVSKSTEEKELEKRQRVEARETEKERKRAEAVRIREERALRKEQEKALAEVNKLRTDKKVSAPEMIVDIPASLSSGLKVQIEALLDDLHVQYATWDSTVGHVVKWRRKVTSRFDDEMGIWRPTALRIQTEEHVLVVVQAAEFVKLALGEEGQDLEAHVLQMKSNFSGSKPIYLIEGLTPWMRRNRNLLNRQFASAVRNLGPTDEPNPSSSQPRRRNNNQPQEYIDEDKIEDALLSLQALHGILVHHTNAAVETAQWIAIFTQHISTIPYRKARDNSVSAGFCMESGQVRTGDGARDTYIRMLQEIARVTAPIAYGIATKYGSLTDLIQGLEEEGPLALAECMKGANKDGALTDRTIGQAISKRVHKIFLGRDPTSTDI